jgi:hypothetical protein
MAILPQWSLWYDDFNHLKNGICNAQMNFDNPHGVQNWVTTTNGTWKITGSFLNANSKYTGPVPPSILTRWLADNTYKTNYINSDIKYINDDIMILDRETDNTLERISESE